MSGKRLNLRNYLSADTEPGRYGPVAFDPTVSRTIDALAADASAALKGIDAGRAAVRPRAWALAGKHAPDHGIDARRPLIIGVDATLVSAPSEKEQAAPTVQRGVGFYPLWAVVDHGPDGSGEPLACQLRTGNAGSNTVADHKTVLCAALAQLPGDRRRGNNVLVRVDGAGGTHELLDWLTRRRLAYSVGVTLPGDLAAIPATLAEVPPAGLDIRLRRRRPGPPRRLGGRADRIGRPAWLVGRHPADRAHGTPAPGAQLRITDVDGHRITTLVTNPRRGQLADLELRHRRRARAEDRIRCPKDTR